MACDQLSEAVHNASDFDDALSNWYSKVDQNTRQQFRCSRELREDFVRFFEYVQRILEKGQIQQSKLSSSAPNTRAVFYAALEDAGADLADVLGSWLEVPPNGISTRGRKTPRLRGFRSAGTMRRYSMSLRCGCMLN